MKKPVPKAEVQQQIETHIAALLNGDKLERIRAIESLIRFGQDVVDTLIALIPESSEYIVVHIIDALGIIGDPRAVPHLMKLLYDHRTLLLRVDIRLALVQIGKAAVPSLLMALESPDENVRHHAVLGLGAIGDARAAAPLRAFLDQTHDLLREDTLSALDRVSRNL